MAVRIEPADLEDRGLQALVREHLADMFAVSPPQSVHALDLSGLADPAVSLWVVRGAGEGDDEGDLGPGDVLACGALKELPDGTGELKAMRTAPAARRRGLAGMLLDHLIAQARDRGYTAVQLETGSQPYFEPARRMYRERGFEECGPFIGYTVDPNSVYLRLALT